MGLYPFNPNIQMGWVIGEFMDMDKNCHLTHYHKNKATLHSWWSGTELGIFVWGSQVATLIYLSRQPSHTHIHKLFYYTHTLFYLISYIYTYTKQQQKEFSNFNQNYVWWRSFIK